MSENRATVRDRPRERAGTNSARLFAHSESARLALGLWHHMREEIRRRLICFSWCGLVTLVFTFAGGLLFRLLADKNFDDMLTPGYWSGIATFAVWGACAGLALWGIVLDTPMHFDTLPHISKPVPMGGLDIRSSDMPRWARAMDTKGFYVAVHLAPLVVLILAVVVF